MPYIPEEDRPQFDVHIDALAKLIGQRQDGNWGGLLNYIVFRLACRLAGIFPLRYKNLSWIKNSLTDARDEFNRRVMDPYEDLAIKKNGDIIMHNDETVGEFMNDI